MENLPAIEKSALPPTMQEKGDDRSREFIPSPQKDHDTVIPRYHDTMQPRYHATTDTSPKNELIETVRKSVKRIGKEAATHRFTLEEKQILADIEYQYKRQGIRTSENEITRIAINYFAEEYKQKGDASILAKILKELNS